MYLKRSVSRLPQHVKTRRYDASGRRAAAARRRDAILAVARDLMLQHGYAATTIGAIATVAGVSPETIYKAFGDKPGIVRALYHKALEGTGEEPAEQRSDRLRGVSTGHQLVAGWADLAREVAPQGAPLTILLRDAAASDPKARSLLHEMDQTRMVRMRDNARALIATGDVRSDLSLGDVTDVLFAVSSAEMYELLVIRRGWTSRRFARFQRDTMAGALLATQPEPDQDSQPNRSPQRTTRRRRPQHGP
jgi:AcrR family transcriptional regulator